MEIDYLECEGCGKPTNEKKLINVMVGVPMEIIAICPECLAKLEDEAEA